MNSIYLKAKILVDKGKELVPSLYICTNIFIPEKTLLKLIFR